MKKLQVVLLALVAMFALTAILASTASAEATLLAEWLIKGAGVTTLTSTTSLGKILLEDTKLGSDVECEGTFDGSVGPNGEDETTEVLNEAGTIVNLEHPLTLSNGCKVGKGCSTTAAVEVAPEGLPWHTLLFLDETTGKFLDNAFKATYTVTCTILGVKGTDECTVTNGTFEVVASAEGGEAKGKVSPAANCTLGGTSSGEEEFIGANHTLNLSEEPVIPSST
jgi:hypothetical protein